MYLSSTRKDFEIDNYQQIKQLFEEIHSENRRME
jgi:hypothetical protein